MRIQIFTILYLSTYITCLLNPFKLFTKAKLQIANEENKTGEEDRTNKTTINTIPEDREPTEQEIEEFWRLTQGSTAAYDEKQKHVEDENNITREALVAYTEPDYDEEIDSLFSELSPTSIPSSTSEAPPSIAPNTIAQSAPPLPAETENPKKRNGMIERFKKAISSKREAMSPEYSTPTAPIQEQDTPLPEIPQPVAQPVPSAPSEIEKPKKPTSLKQKFKKVFTKTETHNLFLEAQRQQKKLEEEEAESKALSLVEESEALSTVIQTPQGLQKSNSMLSWMRGKLSQFRSSLIARFTKTPRIVTAIYVFVRSLMKDVFDMMFSDQPLLTKVWRAGVLLFAVWWYLLDSFISRFFWAMYKLRYIFWEKSTERLLRYLRKRSAHLLRRLSNWLDIPEEKKPNPINAELASRIELLLEDLKKNQK